MHVTELNDNELYELENKGYVSEDYIRVGKVRRKGLERATYRVIYHNNETDEECGDFIRDCLIQDVEKIIVEDTKENETASLEDANGNLMCSYTDGLWQYYNLDDDGFYNLIHESPTFYFGL